MKKQQTKWKLAIVFLAMAMLAVSVPLHQEIIQGANQITRADVIVIDAGHGGIDGGAVSASGTCEKDINLAIAKEIQRLAKADGWKVVMTRKKDEGLYGNEKKAIRSLKTEDLLMRKKIIDRAEPVMAVSIHLNSFKQDSSVRGAQVFYAAGGSKELTARGKNLAETIQKELVKGLNDGTNRAALGKKDVLLLKNPIAPTVIVECGFLSNREEARLLSDEKYQNKLAGSIYKGMLSFSGLEPKVKVKSIDSLPSA